MRGFPDLDDTSPSPLLGKSEPPRQSRNDRSVRPHVRSGNDTYAQQLADANAKRNRPASNAGPLRTRAYDISYVGCSYTLCERVF